MARVRKITLLEQTERAIKVRQAQARDTETTCWIPKSQIDRQSKYPKNPDGTQDMELECPDWLAEAKGLDYD